MGHLVPGVGRVRENVRGQDVQVPLPDPRYLQAVQNNGVSNDARNRRVESSIALSDIGLNEVQIIYT